MSRLWRAVAWTVGASLLASAALGAVALLRHRAGVARAEARWADASPARIADFGVTHRLEILPLVDHHADRDGLLTDMGVSYLVRTDTQTLLFDLGNHSRDDEPAPLTADLAALGVSLDEVDSIVVSHAHFDHVGGRRWTGGAVSGTTFGIGDTQPPLGDRPVIVPVPMTYPGSSPRVAAAPRVLGPGVATTGTIARQLFSGWTEEQALTVRVAGRGLVVIVGCGHQGLPRLLDRVDAVFDEPIYGIVGGLHYPVPHGRLVVAGWIDGQRRLSSGSGPLDPLDQDDVDAELALFAARGVGLLAIGGHDSSDEVIAEARRRFGPAWRDVRVGLPIVVEGDKP